MSASLPLKLQSFLHLVESGQQPTQVDLSSSDLSEFPLELLMGKDFIELINLGNNKLSKLPHNITEFKKLHILFFANNLFDTIPEVLGSMSSLYMLSFKSNKIKYISNDSLSSSVGWLILTDNAIEELPANIGIKLPKLKKCMLAGNKLRKLPDSMVNCKELELIRLAGNHFDELPSWLFTSMPNLSWLAMAGNPISNCIEESTNSNIINWNDIIIKEVLGEGASGIVYKGTLKSNEFEPIDVAVKMFKGNATSDGFPEDEMKVSEAVGFHPHSVRVFGRLCNTPNDQLGLVLSLISPDFYALGGPPSFLTVTRDTYSSDQQFSLSFAVNVLEGIARLGKDLHSRHICHGDLYAHNIFVHNVTGFPFIGDYGASTRYNNIPKFVKSLAPEELYKCIQGIEVRAYGCLVDDLLSRIHAGNSDIIAMLGDIRQQCFHAEPFLRPTFEELSSIFDSIKIKF